MRRIVLVAGCISVLLSSTVYGQNPDTIVIPGDLHIIGTGALVFPDGSVQTQATAQGPQGNPGPANVLSIGTVTTGAPGSSAAATITGTSPAQALNLTIPQGPQGSAGACSSLKWLWSHMTTVTSFAATATTNAYVGTTEVKNIYNSTGRVSGWIQYNVNGSSAGSTSIMSVAAYYTAYDAHNNATNGYISFTPSSTYRITQSYTYDSNGIKTQRVRTWYNGDGSVWRTQTTNYGPQSSYVSEIVTTNGVTTTTNYANTSFDANGNPVMATSTTTNGAGATINTGTIMYEYAQLCTN